MKKKWLVIIPLFILAFLMTGILVAQNIFSYGKAQSAAVQSSSLPETKLAAPASGSGISASSTPASSTPASTAAAPTDAASTAAATTALSESTSLRFIAVGDIMLGRSVGSRLGKAPGGFDNAFSGVSGILKRGDVVFANLESPITSSTHGLDRKKKIVLKAGPQSVEALLSGGFNLLSLANNHMLDYYDQGLFDTMSILDRNGISYAGAGKNIENARKPAIIEKNGIKVGLLSYTDMANIIYAGNPPISHGAGIDKAGVAPREYEAIRQDIQNLRSKVDILAVSLHWGVEESFTVTPAQVEFAHRLLDDGADVILGHHPHQFQGIELYKGKPIFYSMGNFLFDQNDPENMESFIIEMNYKGNKLEHLQAIPVRIVDKSRVVVQTGLSAQNILVRESGLCNKLGTGTNTENDTLAFNIGN